MLIWFSTRRGRGVGKILKFVECFSGEYKKDELLEAARSGNEEQMMALLTPLNVNCHASDGRKVSYNSPFTFLCLKCFFGFSFSND